MLTKMGDVIELLRVSGLRNALRLNKASNSLLANMRPYMIMESLIALEKVGLLKELVKPEGVDVQKLGKLDQHYLRMTMNYLFSVGILDSRNPNCFVLNGDGSILASAVYTSMAYHEPLRELDGLITRKVKYGKDTVRDNYYDAIATEFFTSLFLYPFVAKILSNNHLQSVCDLGCGTGGFPAFLGDREEFVEPYGLDLSKNAIDDGVSKGHSKNAHLFASDILTPEIWMKEIKGKLDAFSIMLVLHEFEDQTISNLLRGLKDNFSRAKIVLTELTHKTPQEARRMKSVPRAEVDFIHGLSLQTIRTEGDWKVLFEQSGYRPKSAVRHDLSNTQVLIFEPLNP